MPCSLALKHPMTNETSCPRNDVPASRSVHDTMQPWSADTAELVSCLTLSARPFESEEEERHPPIGEYKSSTKVFDQTSYKTQRTCSVCTLLCTQSYFAGPPQIARKTRRFDPAVKAASLESVATCRQKGERCAERNFLEHTRAYMQML